jgi:hypothetical protein
MTCKRQCCRLEMPWQQEDTEGREEKDTEVHRRLPVHTVRHHSYNLETFTKINEGSKTKN